MSFAGHVFDMIRRSEANRALVKASRDKAAGLRMRYIGTPADSRPTMEKPIAPARLAGEMRHLPHDARRRLAIVGGILCAAGLAALIGLTWLFL